MTFLYALEQVAFLLDLAVTYVWRATKPGSCLGSGEFDAETLEVGPIDIIAGRSWVVECQSGQVPVHFTI